MSKVTIQRRWPDGDVLAIEVRADSSFPDQLAEASRNALNVYREALGLTMADPDE